MYTSHCIFNLHDCTFKPCYYYKSFTQLLYMVLHRISTTSLFSKRFLKIIKIVTLFRISNILTKRKLFLLLRRSCLWKINIFCYFEKKPLLREGVFAKNFKDLYGFFFFFALSYHSRKQIPHNVTTRYRRDK